MKKSPVCTAMSAINRAASSRECRSAQPKIDDVKALRSHRFECGYASARVVPYSPKIKKHLMAGFACGLRAEGVHDAMTVNALWFGCGGGGMLWLTVDCIGLCRPEIEIIRESLRDFTKNKGCIAINVSCSHTHAGLDTCGYWGNLPRTGKNKLFLNRLFETAQAVAEAAYKNKKTGKLYAANVKAPDAFHRGREPRFVDDKITRIRFVPDDKSKELWFVNISAHPNILGKENRQVSADYVHYMREAVKRDAKANVMFTAGAIGSVDGGFEELKKGECRALAVGEKFASYLCALEDEELECSLKVAHREIIFPDDNDVLTFLNLIGVMNTFKCRDESSLTGFGLVSEMTYIQIGKLKLLCLPGELFPELAYGGYLTAENSATGRGEEFNPTPLAEIAQDSNLVICGVTNDFTGYAVPPNDFILNEKYPCLNSAEDRFGKGHYHETNSLGINTAHVIAENFAQMHKSVQNYGIKPKK